jgi:hypothetical protein
MRRSLRLLLALLLPGGVALGQETDETEASPPPEARPTAPAAPSIPKASHPEPERPQPEMETLISGDIAKGGYGGPLLMYSRVLDRDALFFGGKGGWIVNHRFVLGGGGFGMTTRVPAPAGAPEVGEDLRLEFGYGGVWLEYIFLPEKVFHATVGTLLGGGGVSYNRLRRTDRAAREVESDTVFIIDPVLSAEVNVIRFLRVSAGVGYRYVGSVDLTGLRKEDLSGFTASVMLRFGRF